MEIISQQDLNSDFGVEQEEADHYTTTTAYPKEF